MKVPIKFRGRFWHKDGLVPAMPKYKDGNFVYGGYARLDFLTDIGEGDYIIDKYGEALLVYPDSVAQLVGYDVNGAEVYEGDKIFDKKNTSVVSLNSNLPSDRYFTRVKILGE